MASEKFISELYRGIDDEMKAVTKHPQARLWFSAMVTLGLLLAFEGGDNGVVYRFDKNLSVVYLHTLRVGRASEFLCASRSAASFLYSLCCVKTIVDTAASESGGAALLCGHVFTYSQL